MGILAYPLRLRIPILALELTSVEGPALSGPPSSFIPNGNCQRSERVVSTVLPSPLHNEGRNGGNLRGLVHKPLFYNRLRD